ncbi:hypothetical protein [Kineobactrum salinum]|uniref:Uncharacterized protein n=1 Tax=Kineobactrum salinum TaxID=2708301 RepID=A0A6C0TWT5_9GAMM|nr:hypothetical protein [Kineobactrum salinum]QIB64280.1 hypothetical protein G3T16_01530 [Kineobactrum salinum]
MRRIEGVTLLACSLLLTACSSGTDNGFCEVHARDHWQHREGAARLEIVYETGGALRARLDVPATGLGEDPESTVADLRRRPLTDIMLVEGSEACSEKPSDIAYQGGQLVADYRLDCGEQERLQQLTVKILDLLPDLDEVEVEMETPAVTKHFLVHRRCGAALYNFANTSGSEQ